MERHIVVVVVVDVWWLGFDINVQCSMLAKLGKSISVARYSGMWFGNRSASFAD